MPTEMLDLLIVGAGPAGMLASTIASTIGLKHRVVERRDGTHVHPSAHVLKTHSMEVYRRIGIAEQIESIATPARWQRCINWCESVSGLVYGALDLYGKKGQSARFAAVSPIWSANIPQNMLEPLLFDRARHVADAPDVLRFGAQLVDYVQDADGVTATVAVGNRTEEIRCRYLIGADGAGSQVRRIAGIEMEGPAVLAHFLAINIASDVRPFLDKNPGVLFFVRAPGIEGTFIMHQAEGVQVFMMPFDPEATPFESFDDGRCRDIVRRGFGCEHPFTLTGVGRWTMSAQVASAYRRDRVFLVGDAAHRFPPTGGLGLNTGVEDVENLLWKIGAVVRGEAGDALLDSYAQECRPIALRNTAQSVENNMRMREVAHAIGSDAGDDALRAALAGLHDDDRDEKRPAIQRAIDDQMKHFAHMELEMAATFESGAFLPPGREIALPVPVIEDFQPCFRPGGSMPHLWLEPGVSTIDRLRFDRFILFAPPVRAGAWEAAVDALPPSHMSVEVVPLPAEAATLQASAADFWGGEPYALLVRPDGRIAWVEPDPVGDMVDLAPVMAALTGWSPASQSAAHPAPQPA